MRCFNSQGQVCSAYFNHELDPESNKPRVVRILFNKVKEAGNNLPKKAGSLKHVPWPDLQAAQGSLTGRQTGDRPEADKDLDELDMHKTLFQALSFQFIKIVVSQAAMIWHLLSGATLLGGGFCFIAFLSKKLYGFIPLFAVGELLIFATQSGRESKTEFGYTELALLPTRWNSPSASRPLQMEETQLVFRNYWPRQSDSGFSLDIAAPVQCDTRYGSMTLPNHWISPELRVGYQRMGRACCYRKNTG
eukprot:Gb_38266 [translate_table: standard]